MKFDKIVLLGLTIIIGSFMYVKMDKNIEEHNEKINKETNGMFSQYIQKAKDNMNDIKNMLNTKNQEEVSKKVKPLNIVEIKEIKEKPFECIKDELKVNCYLRGDYKKGDKIKYTFDTLGKDFDKYEKTIKLEEDKKELVFSRFKINRETIWELKIEVNDTVIRKEKINVKGL